MKIKCPACSKVLSVPEAAYGKLVKCPCGKQIRVPAGKTTATPPAATRPATRPATQPAPEHMDSSIFDDMTEMDLQPVRAVNRPGQVAPVTSGSSALAKAGADMAKESAGKKKNRTGNAKKQVMSSIGILLFLGLLRVGFGIFLYMGAESEVAGLEGEFDGELSTLLMIVRIVYGIQILMGTIFLTCAACINWFPMTASITAMVTFVLGEILGLVINPLGLLSIGGWVFRTMIFGGLAQAINNASFYKYVKAGG